MTRLFYPAPRPFQRRRLVLPPEGFVYDSFSDANGKTLATHDGERGATWAVHPSYSLGSYPRIINNRVRAANSNGFVLVYASGEPPTSEYSIRWKQKVKSTSKQLYICGRVSETDDTFYTAGYNYVFGYWEIGKQVNGTYFQLGTWTDSPADESEQECILDLTDAAKKLYVDGVERISSADNTITDKGRVGVQYWDNGTDTTGIHLDYISAVGIGALTVSYTETDLEDPLPAGAEFTTDAGFVFHYTYAKNAAGGEQVDLLVELREDVSGSSVVRADWSHTNIGDTPVEADQAITTGEAAAVVDWNEVYVRWTETRHGGDARHVEIDDVELETPGIAFTVSSADAETGAEGAVLVLRRTGAASDIEASEDTAAALRRAPSAASDTETGAETASVLRRSLPAVSDAEVGAGTSSALARRFGSATDAEVGAEVASGLVRAFRTAADAEAGVDQAAGLIRVAGAASDVESGIETVAGTRAASVSALDVESGPEGGVPGVVIPRSAEDAEGGADTAEGTVDQAGVIEVFAVDDESGADGAGGLLIADGVAGDAEAYLEALALAQLGQAADVEAGSEQVLGPGRLGAAANDGETSGDVATVVLVVALVAADAEVGAEELAAARVAVVAALDQEGYLEVHDPGRLSSLAIGDVEAGQDVASVSDTMVAEIAADHEGSVEQIVAARVVALAVEDVEVHLESVAARVAAAVEATDVESWTEAASVEAWLYIGEVTAKGFQIRPVLEGLLRI
ncbi:MAG: hypothetical protein LC798_13775 [Chloroflexi bacterium]|nr:hypothetical protein [Chloroflexota bacterium]